MRHFFSLIIAVVLGASLFPAPASASYRCEEYPHVTAMSFPGGSTLHVLETVSFRVEGVDPDTIRFLIDGMPPANAMITEVDLATYDVLVTLQKPFVQKGDSHILITGNYVQHCPLRYVHLFSMSGKYDDGTGNLIPGYGEDGSNPENGSSDPDENEGGNRENGDNGETTGHDEVEEEENDTTFQPFRLLFDIEGHWAEDIIRDYVERGIMSPYSDGSFRPNHPLVRAYATEVSLSVFGHELQTTLEPSFPDVAKGSWYYAVVTTGESLNVARGYGDGLFRPLQNTSRAEALALALRAAGYDDKNLNGGELSFGDVEEYGWYANMIAWAEDEGIVEGYGDGSFRPNNAITRAEFLAILDRIEEKQATENREDYGVLSLPQSASIIAYQRRSVAPASRRYTANAVSENL